MPLPLIAAGIQALAGVASQSAAGPNLSGTQGDFRAGGITVGSKVVGSGSASTVIPSIESSGGTPLSVQPDGTIGTGSASLVSQPWFPIVIGAAVLALLLLIPRRKK